MDDAHYPYGHGVDSMGKNIQVENAEIEFDGKRNKETSQDIADTIRSLRVELQSYREENERTIKVLEGKIS